MIIVIPVGLSLPGVLRDAVRQLGEPSLVVLLGLPDETPKATEWPSLTLTVTQEGWFGDRDVRQLRGLLADGAAACVVANGGTTRQMWACAHIAATFGLPAFNVQRGGCTELYSRSPMAART